MTDDPLAQMFRAQAQVCASFGSPFYGALLGRAAADLAELGDLFAPWAGQTLEELMGAAVALRFLGAVHDLALSGDDLPLAAAFPPVGDADALPRPGRIWAWFARWRQRRHARRFPTPDFESDGVLP